MSDSTGDKAYRGFVRRLAAEKAGNTGHEEHPTSRRVAPASSRNGTRPATRSVPKPKPLPKAKRAK